MQALIVSISIIIGVIIIFLILDLIAFKPPKRINPNDIHENHLDICEKRYFKSGHTLLRGFLYKAESPKGLIIFTHGIGSGSDYYIPEILALRNNGYNVFTFDYKGYYKNKGLFPGIFQAVKDLNYAINFIDNGQLPLTLIGHSLGGYIVSAVKRINKHKIKNIITVSAFSNPLEILKETLIRVKFPKILIPLIQGICAFSQTLYFGLKWHTNSYKILNQNKDINYAICHSKNDEIVSLTKASLLAKNKLIKVPNIQYFVFEEAPYDTHMGIIRGDKESQVNEELINVVLKNIK